MKFKEVVIGALEIMRYVVILLIIVLIVSLTGCSKSEANKAVITQQESQIKELKSDIKKLKKEKAALDDIILEGKQEKGVARYIVTINIKQSHFFLDIENNIKDEMNDINIEIPVDKEFYDSVEEGTVIDDSFRVGSLLLKGSVGNWDITVADKDIR